MFVFTMFEYPLQKLSPRKSLKQVDKQWWTTCFH